VDGAVVVGDVGDGGVAATATPPVGDAGVGVEGVAGAGEPVDGGGDDGDADDDDDDVAELLRTPKRCNVRIHRVESSAF